MTERIPIKMDVTVYREYNQHRFKDFMNVYKVKIEKYIISKKNLLYEDNIYLKSINIEYMIETKM